jgi:class 3 adenylate cyclase
MAGGMLFNSSLLAQQSSSYLERVIVNYDSVIYYGNQDTLISEPVSLSHSSNNFLFRIAGPAERYYSFYLEGYDKTWSDWSEFPLKEYTNLKSGKYRLLMREGEQGIITGETCIYKFTIRVPLYLSPFFLALYAVLSILVFWFVYRLLIARHIRKQEILENLVSSRTEELKSEKERTETLLANVLPKGTADELMLKGKATKKKFNFATVLFSDIQGFTKIAEEVNPEVLIDELDKFFFHFDTVVEKYNIEKIKTIGDAYMCAGGIPQSNRTNPVEVILAALEMQEYMKNLKKARDNKNKVFWDIRIGLHTGTIIAGVVGHKKLTYDIWGDTVNIASRMESSGEAGKINISGTTYEYARDFFFCEYRGKMPVKYKGELDMYFVNGIRPELRKPDSNEPNDNFILKMLMLKIQDLEDSVFSDYEAAASPDLKFHDARYLKNVSTQTELIGRAELLSDKEMLVLRLASVFIFAGYSKSYSGFLNESLALMNEMAPDFGFTDKHLSEAKEIIEDALKEKPESHAGNILSDARNDFLGRVDLLLRLEMLYLEKEIFEGSNNKTAWFKKQVQMLRQFEFKTNTARLLRTNSPETQVNAISDFISSL